MQVSERMLAGGMRSMPSPLLACWQPILLLVLGSVLSGSATGCPPRCECSAQDRAVLCHRKRFVAVPEGIPTETRLLDLGKNRIKTLNQDEFASFPHLEELELNENIVSAVEPGAFNNLFNLRTLGLRSNRLKLIPLGVFTGLSNLTKLDISENKIVILLDYMFQDLYNLKSLEVGDNDLVYISHRAFSGLNSLEQLTLEKCNLTSIPTEALSHLHGLIVLRLRHLNINAIRDYSFKRLYRLKVLEISHWPYLDTMTPNCLYGLNLTSLSITHCNLTAAHLHVRSYSPDWPHQPNKTFAFISNQPGEGEANSTRATVPFPFDIKTLIIATTMGFISFLGVVLFCLVLLFLWSRGKGNTKHNIEIEYVPRKSDAGISSADAPRKFNMKMI